MLTADELERFAVDGFIAVRQVIPRPVLEACQRELDEELLQAGVDPSIPSTWVEPVVRFNCPESPSFAAAGTQPRLWEAYDQLIGPDRYVRRHGVGGTVPVRFPSTTDPGDAGWHIDGSFTVGDSYGVTYHSAWRGLLCLFLFSDIGPDDAPTEVKVGSHLFVPPTLLPLGEAGGLYDVKQSTAFAAIAELPSTMATGKAGDVYLCHPFLVHRATWPHRGERPRWLAQPGVGIDPPFALTGAGEVFPVEQCILDGLHRAGIERSPDGWPLG